METKNNYQPTTRVAIVDDHKMVVESLGRMIHESGVAQVTGKYYSLQSCRKGLANEMPDVLLLDIGLPDGDGVEFCAEAMQNYPSLKIIMLTSYKEFNIAKHALYNGALGYVLKNADAEEIFTAIKTVGSGEQFLCEEINLLLKDKNDTKAVWLTNREKEILKYTAEGFTAKETASFICRDTETVKFYRKKLFLKLDVKNMAELIRKAYEMKLV
ncbi:MAG: response regulator transcription factor [Cytophagaceae bacterium]|jgi:DNA-binding NarL/FixJ family response regulator|nr:response regulator transcription factor [Cytophagaceae bacterium]